MSLTKNKTVKLHEYQYLNLIKDNILLSVETETDNNIAEISSTNWQPIRYFSYKESQDSEPKTENEVRVDKYT